MIQTTRNNVLLMRRIAVLLLLLVGPRVLVADLVLDQWGAFVEMSAFSGDVALNDFAGSRGGREFHRASHMSGTEIGSSLDAGDVFALAEMNRSSGLGLPELRASAETYHPTSSSYATAGAIEGYTYLGESNATFQLEVDLTGFTTGNASISALAGVMDATDFSFDIYNAFEYTPLSDVASLFIDSNNPGPKSQTLVFEVMPGQSFYVAANLSTSASGENSKAQSINSLTTNITGDPVAVSNLVSVSSVPVPSAFLCLGLIVSGLCSVRRISKRSGMTCKQLRS